MGAAGVASGPSILYVEDVFSTWTYTGNGGTQTITNGLQLSSKGGLVWVKSRDGATSHILVDSVRGNNKGLLTNATIGQQDFTGSENQISLTSNGFTVATSGPGGSVNVNNQTYVGWSFREAPKFFDIVSYTGDGQNNRIVNHNLGSVPGFILIKNLGVLEWGTYHRSLGAGKFLKINSSDGADTASVFPTTPTSTQFFVNNFAAVNASGNSYIAYVFAHNAGGFGPSENQDIISCGSYTGTGTAGLQVDLGWEPQWLLVKNTSAVGDWRLFDNFRGLGVTGIDRQLFPHLSEAESNPVSRYAINSTGFQVTSTDNANTSGNVYIYVAIRRGPMKTPTDATTVFSISQAVGTPRYQAAFPPDLIIQTSKSYAFNQPFSRITGTRYMTTTATTSEASFTGWTWDYMNGTGNSFTDSNYLAWMFRRAPGFFDVVAYTGTGSARTVAHSLGAVPQLMIVKSRSVAGYWNVYHSALSATELILLDQPDGAAAGFSGWNSTRPTSSVFSLNAAFNPSGQTFINYLFASCPGVSKVGSYTGTGATLSVDCGFTAGARFVLIKRTDASGDWYVWDTARGIIAANDPYLLLNSTAAEVTNTDYIDPLAAGFQISSTAPAAINASGGSYIYLAIA